jgi:hypothetical protein
MIYPYPNIPLSPKIVKGRRCIGVGFFSLVQQGSLFMGSVVVFGKPAFVDPSFLFKQLHYGPKAGKGKYTQKN